MRLTLSELSSSLKKSLVPVYFLTGEEPLQLGEAADAIRSAARHAGYAVREVLTVDAHFEWQSVLQEAGSLSIFADKKIIDLRIPEGKFGGEGGKILQQYCDTIPEDTILLITAGKLPRDANKSRWYAAIDQAGVIVQVKPLAGPELVNWLQQRADKRGLKIEVQGIKVLADRIEGNLLAAAQEIEKLYVLFGHAPISTEAMLDVIADNARYDVFKLVDSVLSGKVKRSAKILFGLRDEAIAAPVVLWALTREIRILASIKEQLHQRLPREQIFKSLNIWDVQKKNLINALLPRLDARMLDNALVLSANADQQIKGQQPGNPWETMLRICLLFA